MSKIGKKSILVPGGVSVALSGREVTVKGPKGELRRLLPAGFNLEQQGNFIALAPPAKYGKQSAALWGTYRQHLANMVEGVQNGFAKTLEFEGIGYRAEVTGAELVLYMGFTHPVKLVIPAGLKAESLKNTITISGADKELVGEFTAIIRSVRPPEPYKGTGIRYQGEIIRRKAGKKLAGTAG